MSNQPCKTPTAKNLRSLSEFLSDHAKLLARLPTGTQDIYVRLCSLLAHMRSQRARNFFMQTLAAMESLTAVPHADEILKRALLLGAESWSLVIPYFDNAKIMAAHDGLLEEWTHLTLRLAERDIDVAKLFLEQSARALKAHGPQGMSPWAGPALGVLNGERGIWRVAKAYLEESLVQGKDFGLKRWEFLLDMATDICGSSERAAEAFVRKGSHTCRLLNTEEVRQWVLRGLSGNQSQDDLVGYFSATSAVSREQRDGLISGIKLSSVSNTLALICEAYLGRPVRVRSNESLCGVEGFKNGAATDGRTVFLPPKASGFTMLKLMALHQCALLDQTALRLITGSENISHTSAHLASEKALLSVMPGLRADMDRAAQGQLPPHYPQEPPLNMSSPPPWWGDFLPVLKQEANAAICQLKQKAEEINDLPSEVVEALLEAMMAKGRRDVAGLWSQLNQLFDTIEFESPDAQELDEEYKTFYYREWDKNLGDYKVDWCLVRQRTAKDHPNDMVATAREARRGQINLIRRQFERLKPERIRKYRAQPYGDDLDIDALISSLVERLTSGWLNENVYVRRDKKVRDVAVLFLVDQSISTEEKIAGRRVIDIQKEAMVLMAEALESLGDPYGIMGFSSEGRLRVDLFMVKDFYEEYDQTVRHRLGNLQPLHYTRMGAVVRHAASRLAEVPAAIKLLVILTDGRPYDAEYGKLDYAMEDTKKALIEARQQRINPMIITTDQKGASYLKRISPQTQSIIVPRVEMLPTVLPNLYRRLTT